MKVTTLAALLLAYCILVACTRTSPNAQLVQADSLMQKSPDSALHFLEKIYPEKLKSLDIIGKTKCERYKKRNAIIRV